MNEQEILEGNKLIAEFMGLHQKGSNAALTYDTSLCWYDNEDHLVYNETLKYHTLWDWLMPVVDKLRDVLSKNTTSNTIGYLVSLNNPPAWEEWNSLEEVWQAVVKFLKN